MSLQVKFLLLVGTLLIAVIGSVAAAGWSLAFVQREVSRPFDQMSQALGELGRIKRSIEHIDRVIGPEGAFNPSETPRGIRNPDAPLTPRVPTESDRAALASAAQTARDHAQQLERSDWYVTRIGVSTWSNIRDRLRSVIENATAWAESADETRRAAARRSTYELHELIEMTELRLLDDARRAVANADDIRIRLGWLLVMVTLGAAMVCALGVVLLQRWVQRPVASLREAASRIAAGDFTHRVHVRTGDEIGQLMSEVNHMAGMVDQYQHEAVERERLAAVGQMVRRIVHNVRNPLAGIRGLAEVSRLDAQRDSELHGNLSLIVSTVDTFERWLGELLESTRPLEIQPIQSPINSWLHDVVRSHESGAKARNIRLVFEPGDDALAMIDPRHLEHAVAAVLANAIDASTDGGSVFVRTGIVQNGEFIEISIQDQGQGVPESLRDQIFEPHFTTKAKGTGIGLAIARQILRSHGGTVTLDSPPSSKEGHSGACFRLRVPLAPGSTGGMVAQNSHQTG